MPRCAYHAGERALQSWLPRRRANLVWICPAPTWAAHVKPEKNKAESEEATLPFLVAKVDGPTALDAWQAPGRTQVPCGKMVKE